MRFPERYRDEQNAINLPFPIKRKEKCNTLGVAASQPTSRPVSNAKLLLVLTKTTWRPNGKCRRRSNHRNLWFGSWPSVAQQNYRVASKSVWTFWIQEGSGIYVQVTLLSWTLIKIHLLQCQYLFIVEVRRWTGTRVLLIFIYLFVSISEIYR